MKEEDPFVAALAPLLLRRWLLVGIGQELRGDDAFGPRLARRIAQAGGPALDAGSAPENQTGKILSHAPEVLLLADAADLGEAPGTLRLVPAEDMSDAATSTHDPGLGLLLAYLLAQAPDLRVHLIAVQAVTRELGAPVDDAVLRAEERVAGILWPGPVT